MKALLVLCILSTIHLNQRLPLLLCSHNHIALSIRTYKQSQPNNRTTNQETMLSLDNNTESLQKCINNKEASPEDLTNLREELLTIANLLEEKEGQLKNQEKKDAEQIAQRAEAAKKVEDEVAKKTATVKELELAMSRALSRVEEAQKEVIKVAKDMESVCSMHTITTNKSSATFSILGNKGRRQRRQLPNMKKFRPIRIQGMVRSNRLSKSSTKSTTIKEDKVLEDEKRDDNDDLPKEILVDDISALRGALTNLQTHLSDFEERELVEKSNHHDVPGTAGCMEGWSSLIECCYTPPCYTPCCTAELNTAIEKDMPVEQAPTGEESKKKVKTTSTRRRRKAKPLVVM